MINVCINPKAQYGSTICANVCVEYEALLASAIFDKAMFKNMLDILLNNVATGNIRATNVMTHQIFWAEYISTVGDEMFADSYYVQLQMNSRVRWFI